jgi:LemA protein
MTESIIVAVFSVIAFVAVAAAFIYFYFRSVRQEIREYWGAVRVKLRDRLDKIPNLIETLRMHTEGQEELINGLIAVRSETWPIKKASKERVHAELHVSSKLHQVWALSKQFDDLRKNTNYLELKMEFKEIGKEIEEMEDVYNHKVRKYNKIVGNVALRPVLGLMRFKKLAIFEFEA